MACASTRQTARFAMIAQYIFTLLRCIGKVSREKS
jgi:hypothetical protein